jgi:hypothetical protein
MLASIRKAGRAVAEVRIKRCIQLSTVFNEQSCSYIDVLLVTWLAKREGDSRRWPCASWSVTIVIC